MPFRHTLQTSRFELKYIIDEQRAAGIRDFISSHLEHDEHAKPELGYAYSLSSLYMDSPSLTLFNQTRHGIKNRFKLRIRFYDDNPDSPAFLEIKRRVTDVISKERATVTREAVGHLLSGDGPSQSWLMRDNSNPESGSALLNFWNLCDHIDAAGRIYVSYTREAYVSPNSNSVRVTFDRQLFGTPHEQGCEISLPSDGVRPNVGGTILELKFTDRFPEWLRELVQAFDLQRTSVPKYNHCIMATGLHLPRTGLGTA